MKTYFRRSSFVLLAPCLAAILSFPSVAQQLVFDKYHTPAEISGFVSAFAKSQPDLIKVHSLAKTYQGIDYQVIEIGKETKSTAHNNPAVLVVANLEATAPLASEGALLLIRELLKNPERLDSLTWYVLACGNPDGAANFFRKPLIVDGRNLRPWNDDMDEQTDEDGPDDLNADVFITQMRGERPRRFLYPR
jgi:hypothetical protein